MDFLNKAKAVIVPHGSTLFITDNRQAHAIATRQEAEKERVLTTLRFTKCRKGGYLATLTRDKGTYEYHTPDITKEAGIKEEMCQNE